MENRRYQLHNNGGCWAKPFIIMVRGNGFWQQISPNFLYEKCARNWAKRHNIKLEN